MSQAKGTLTLSWVFVKRPHPQRNTRQKTGRVQPAANLPPQPPASLGSRVGGLARTPSLGPAQQHLQRGMLPPPLQLPRPSKQQPGPDPQPLQRSKAENHHRSLPRRAGWPGGQRREVAPGVPGTRARTPAAVPQPHTHPLSASFVLRLCPGRAAPPPPQTPLPGRARPRRRATSAPRPARQHRGDGQEEPAATRGGTRQPHGGRRGGSV